MCSHMHTYDIHVLGYTHCHVCVCTHVYAHILMHTCLCSHTGKHIHTCVSTHALIHTVGLTSMSVQGGGLL